MTGRLFVFWQFSLWSILVVPLSAQYVSIFDTSLYDHDRPLAPTGEFGLTKSTGELGTLDPLIVELGLSTDDASKSNIEKPLQNNAIDCLSNLLLHWADSQNSPNYTAEDFEREQDSEKWFIPTKLSHDERTYERLVDENLIPQISAFLDDFIKIGGNSFGYFTLPAERFHYDTAGLSSLKHYYHYALTDQFLSHAGSFLYSGRVKSALNKTDNFPAGEDSVFSFRPESLHTNYPNFSFVRDEVPKFTFNAFLENPFVPIPHETMSVKKEVKTGGAVKYIKSSRQRRAGIAWYVYDTYMWELNDFDPTNTNPPNSSGNFVKVVDQVFPDDHINTFNSTPGDDEISLYITAPDGVGSLSVLAYGTTGGNALNDYAQDDGFLIMTATNSNLSDGDVSSKFALETSGIDAWLNGFDGYRSPGISTDPWGVWKEGDNFYLTYEFSNLNFSPVPEPSSYFMTGALFCLIGFNRTSRNSIKKFLFPLWGNILKNGKPPEVEKKVS